MTIATRESILSLIPESKPTPAEIPGVDGVFVRELSGAEAAELATAAQDGQPADFAVRMIVLAICDRSGEPLFSEKDAQALKKVRSEVFAAMVDAAGAKNGLAATEDAEGN